MINAAALDLIKSFEGYGKKLDDGRCEAYQEVINGKTDIPTIGYGCTKGVVMGMVWTEAEAEAALMRELAIHEKRVDELVTIDLNENERGALVSFDYNCGGLHSNTLKAINSGDRQRAVDALKLWNKFGGKPANGLIRRRAAEVALFLKPVADVSTSFMPQQPEASAPKPARATVATAAAGTGIGGGLLIPAVPEAINASASNLDGWTALAGKFSGLDLKVLALSVVTFCVVTFGLPLLKMLRKP